MKAHHVQANLADELKAKVFPRSFRAALKSGVARGELVQVKQSFKLSDAAKAQLKKKNKLLLKKTATSKKKTKASSSIKKKKKTKKK